MTDSKPSKSARKREQLALRELGEQLISLNESELASLSLDEGLQYAISKAKQMTSHGALRRQKQLIGKLMRDIDPLPIRAQLGELRADDVRNKRLFAKAEGWRDRIVKDGAAALEAFEDETGHRDDGLRSMLVELGLAFSDKAEKTLRRKIFRRVHEILGSIPK